MRLVYPDADKAGSPASLHRGVANELPETLRRLNAVWTVYQAPWYEGGEYRGLIEVVLVLPEALPHFVRDGG